MKKILLSFVALIALSGPAMAVTGSTLPTLGNGAAASTSDLVALRQGSNTVDTRETLGQLSTLFLGQAGGAAGIGANGSLAYMSGGILTGATPGNFLSIASGQVNVSSASAILDSLSSLRGSVLYRGSAGWAAAAPGTSGQVWTTYGTGADPAWSTVSGGGGGAPGGTSGQIQYNSGGAFGGSSLTTLMDTAFGATQGGTLVRGSSGWQTVVGTTSGTVLTWNGVGTTPSYSAGGGGGSGTFSATGTATDRDVVVANGTSGTAGTFVPVTIDASGDIATTGTLTTNAHTITGSGTALLTVGPTGFTTNQQAFTASAVSGNVDGIGTIGAATGGTVYVRATGTDTNIPLTLQSQGGGNITFTVPGGGTFTWSINSGAKLSLASTAFTVNSAVSFVNNASSSTFASLATFNGAATMNGAANLNGLTTISGGLKTSLLQVTSATAVTVVAATITYDFNSATTHAVTLDACSSSNTGEYHEFKDGGNNAATYNDTITPATGNTIDVIYTTSSPLVYSTNRAGNTLKCDGAGNWLIIN